jgi:hypothetical protein
MLASTPSSSFEVSDIESVRVRGWTKWLPTRRD